MCHGERELERPLATYQSPYPLEELCTGKQQISLMPVHLERYLEIPVPVSAGPQEVLRRFAAVLSAILPACIIS